VRTEKPVLGSQGVVHATHPGLHPSGHRRLWCSPAFLGLRVPLSLALERKGAVGDIRKKGNSRKSFKDFLIIEVRE